LAAAKTMALRPSYSNRLKLFEDFMVREINHIKSTNIKALKQARNSTNVKARIKTRK
jgi:hypothetical protein